VCLLLTLLFLGPRAAILFSWIGWQDRWEAAFDSFFVPFVGFLVFPWTTLIYVTVAPSGVEGFDYVLLGLGVLCDLSSFVAGGRYDRTKNKSVGVGTAV
jgi:hypothetical protein